MDHENLIERIYDIVTDVNEWREHWSKTGDASAARNAALAITHLEEAAFRIGPPTWYRPNPRAGR